MRHKLVFQKIEEGEVVWEKSKLVCSSTWHNYLKKMNISRKKNFKKEDQLKIVKMRDEENKSFAEIADIMVVSNRIARNLYMCGLRVKGKELFGKLRSQDRGSTHHE